MAVSYNTTDLQILKALWTTKQMSAREVHDALLKETGWSYSTTRTLLARMEEKGIIARADFHGVAVYSAAASRVQVLGQIARDLTRGVFDIKGALPASMFAGRRPERQVLALYAHIKRRETEAIGAVRCELETLKRIRDAYCQRQPLAIDDLIDKLDDALRSSKV